MSNLGSAVFAAPPPLDNVEPIFTSNKDVNVALNAEVYRQDGHKSYKSKMGLNFKEEESVVVNDVKIKIMPVRKGDDVRMMVELYDAKTGNLMKTSSMDFNDNLQANAEISHPDNHVDKVDITFERLD